jgi:hypothetical protein
MDEVPWTVTAFKQRRDQTWKATRFWWLLLVIGSIGFYVPFYLERAHAHNVAKYYDLSSNDETEGEFTMGLVSFVIAGAAVIGITVGTRRHYRCPKCEEIPIGSWSSFGPSSISWQSGVELFPSVCRNCGAQLR